MNNNWPLSPNQAFNRLHRSDTCLPLVSWPILSASSDVRAWSRASLISISSIRNCESAPASVPSSIRMPSSSSWNTGWVEGWRGFVSLGFILYIHPTALHYHQMFEMFLGSQPSDGLSVQLWQINYSLDGFHSPCTDHDSKAWAESCMLCSREPTGFLSTSVLSAKENSSLEAADEKPGALSPDNRGGNSLVVIYMLERKISLN